jgi:hypothetical protein
MSGIEVAGLIIPLIIEGAKLYKRTHEKIRTCREYSKEVRRINDKFEVQKDLFINEAVLLLRLVRRDSRAVKRMLRHPELAQWTELEDIELNKCLDSSYDTAKTIMEDILDKVGELEERLSCFDEIISQKRKVSQRNIGMKPFPLGMQSAF